MDRIPNEEKLLDLFSLSKQIYCVNPWFNTEQMLTVDFCRHQSCVECVKRYIEVKLVEGGVLSCPHYQFFLWCRNGGFFFGAFSKMHFSRITPYVVYFLKYLFYVLNVETTFLLLNEYNEKIKYSCQSNFWCKKKVSR